jgi:hypothetical protein
MDLQQVINVYLAQMIVQTVSHLLQAMVFLDAIIMFHNKVVELTYWLVEHAIQILF